MNARSENTAIAIFVVRSCPNNFAEKLPADHVSWNKVRDRELLRPISVGVLSFGLVEGTNRARDFLRTIRHAKVYVLFVNGTGCWFAHSYQSRGVGRRIAHDFSRFLYDFGHDFVTIFVHDFAFYAFSFIDKH